MGVCVIKFQSHIICQLLSCVLVTQTPSPLPNSHALCLENP